jgi:3-phosphoshikimate 1-carboxyvinyltransferase
MICISIGTKGSAAVNEALSKAHLAEIRLDLTQLNREETAALFRSKKDLIATCRAYEMPYPESRKMLLWAILGSRTRKSKGKRYIDLDYDSPEDYRNELITAARKGGFKIILSYHNFNNTESYERLCEIYENSRERGADIVKLVTNAKTIQECSRLIRLYKQYPKDSLVTFSIGDEGKFTRLLSHSIGAPFIYCALDEESRTAPGQFTVAEAERLTSKKFYPHNVNRKGVIKKITAPASKSHAQRAILSAAWAKGKSSLYAYTPCADTEAAIELVRSLGVKVKSEKCKLPKFRLEITSPGIEEISKRLAKEEIFSKNIKKVELNVGESGLLCRLMLPTAGHLPGKSKGVDEVTITGEGSLKKRELFSTDEPLKNIGLNVATTDGKLPAVVSGSIKGSSFNMSGKGGSQLLSGMLMALPMCEKSSVITLSEPTSTPYIELTVKTIKEFGVIVTNEDPLEFKIPGRQKYKSKAFLPIEGDWSGASMLMVAGAISSGITITNLPINSKQADEKILDVLRGCGAEVKITEYPKYLVMCGDVPCALKDDNTKEIILGSKIEIFPPKGNLMSFEFDATNSPDLFPTLVVLALNCSGISRIKGVGRLSNKESNRAESLFCEFTRLGAHIDIDGDSMIVEGGELHGGLCSSYKDHRIAMSLITASLNIKDKVYVDDLNCISKSFPDFIKNFK